MSLSLGIVGLPNVGKSTLFNALTRNKVLAANYPFATIEPNSGVVPVPDERLAKLAELYNPEKIVPATVNFMDIAGLVAGASKGEGLGNQFLAHIRETSAIAQVVRAFEDSNITHVANEIHPQKDIETINTELILADIQTITNYLERIRKTAKADPKIKPTIEALEVIQAALDEGKLISELLGSESTSEYSEKLKLSEEAATLIKNLMTAKPILYVFNVDEAGLNDSAKQADLSKLVAPAQSIFICAQLEAELSTLSPSEAKELLTEYGLKQSGLELLITAGFKTLDLQTYLTAGPKEVRAWTIPIGATAPQAAGVIHTDFERGFIAAEVVNYEDLIATGSKAAAKAAGKLRTEGKDYMVRDGDVIEFRFNV